MKIHLQSVGEVPAIYAGNLNSGDITIWNGGLCEEILSIVPTETGKSVICYIVAVETGNVYRRVMRVNRKVGIKSFRRE